MQMGGMERQRDNQKYNGRRPKTRDDERGTHASE